MQSPKAVGGEGKGKFNMHLRILLLFLVTTVLCLVLLMMSLNTFSGGVVVAEGAADYHAEPYHSSFKSDRGLLSSSNNLESSSSIPETGDNMGDKRRGSGSGEKSPSVKSTTSSTSSNSNSQYEDALSTIGVPSSSVSSEQSESQSQPHDHFDIVQLNRHLNICIREKDHEVDLDEYISVFQQLYKFFIMLGTVFGFVGSDVKAKLEILEGYRKGEGKSSYETVEKMLEFEKRTDFIHTNKESSGSRTLLRLHRALNFVSKFLGKIDGLKDSDGTSHVAKEAYTDTLAKYHPWLIQKGAILAMYALPNKKDLISKVCDGKIEASEARRLLHDVIASTEKVYNQCEAAYKGHDLLTLP